MIKKISIEGYKSIKELQDFELKPLNVLIGPNKGGKSNFLDFLGLIGEAARGRLSNGLNDREGIRTVIWAGGDIEGISTLLELEHDRDYSFSLNPMLTQGYRITEYFNGVKVREGDKLNEALFVLPKGQESLEFNELALCQVASVPEPLEFLNIRLGLMPIEYYREFNTSRNSAIRKPLTIYSAGTSADTTLDEGGGNLTNVFYHLFNSQKSTNCRDEILSILESVFDGFEEITFPMVQGRGGVLMGWKEKPFEKPFFLSDLSDGTLKFLCLLAIFMNPNPQNIVCIDEPEAGLHPYMMDVLAEIIDEASERMQIVITTHSPRFLSNFKPEDIVVVENENGESKFERPDPERLKKWLEDFSLGKLYEMGELGGLM